MNHRIVTSFVLLLSVIGAWAQGPNNTGTYYQSANGKKGADLKTALFNIVKSPSVVSYAGLIDAYRKTDTRPDGYLRDWYSNTTNFRHDTDKAGNYKQEGDVYNREHSVPSSWFSKASPMYSDVVHVIPADGYVNNRRSNYPFGEVGTATYQSNNGYSKLGSCRTAGYSGTVFEPNDAVKGDIARIYFYMVTCYEDRISGWTGNAVASQVLDGQKYPGLQQWTLDMMMRWAQLDPIDEVERARNEAVQEVQGNRNPFVDYPGLEAYIWGDKTDKPFSYDNFEGTGTVGVSEPIISPRGGTFYGQQTVTITCITEGADIYFTFDDTTPSPTNGQRYTQPLTISESGILKAVAVKDGTSSHIASATFVITDEPQPQPSGNIYTKVTSTDQLQAGDRYIIVYEESAGQGKVLTGIDAAGKRGNAAEVIITNGVIDSGELTDEPLLMTLEQMGGQWAFNADGTYMALSDNSNSLSTATNAQTDNALWTLTVSATTVDIVSVAYSNRSLRYNKSADMFRCYTGGQNPVTLYRLTSTNGIAQPTIPSPTTGKLFDLQGCPVHAATPGSIYILEGRKFIYR